MCPKNASRKPCETANKNRHTKPTCEGCMISSPLHDQDFDAQLYCYTTLPIQRGSTLERVPSVYAPLMSMGETGTLPSETRQKGIGLQMCLGRRGTRDRVSSTQRCHRASASHRRDVDPQKG